MNSTQHSRFATIDHLRSVLLAMLSFTHIYFDNGVHRASQSTGFGTRTFTEADIKALSDDTVFAVAEGLAQTSKIQFIKGQRTLTGSTLKDAKDFADWLARDAYREDFASSSEVALRIQSIVREGTMFAITVTDGEGGSMVIRQAVAPSIDAKVTLVIG